MSIRAWPGRRRIDGAALLFVATNNAWYGEGASAYQHAAHSVLRAVENRRPLLRVGNGGWSGWIDEYGLIRNVLLNDEGTIYFRGGTVFEIDRDRRWVGRTTFYTRHGDWFVWVSLGLVLIGAFLLKRRPYDPMAVNRFESRVRKPLIADIGMQISGRRADSCRGAPWCAFSLAGPLLSGGNKHPLRSRTEGMKVQTGKGFWGDEN